MSADGVAVRRAYTQDVTEYELDGAAVGLVPVDYGRGQTRIRPERGSVTFTDGVLRRVEIEGRVIKRDGAEATGRIRWQRWVWTPSYPRRGGSWPPLAAPPVALRMVELAELGGTR